MANNALATRAAALPSRAPKISVVQYRRLPISAEPRVDLAAEKGAKPQSPELIAKRFATRRAARIANDQLSAARCYHRACHWADAIREGLDADIARFARDQVAAWQFLSASYARSARDALIGPEDAQ
jgi:hypothetical protein